MFDIELLEFVLFERLRGEPALENAPRYFERAWPDALLQSSSEKQTLSTESVQLLFLLRSLCHLLRPVCQLLHSVR
jgi:hypothetical protein